MKYYQAILALASAAGFDVLEDAKRMQTILPDIFQADEELRMENPLMRQALADALSMWKKQMWGGQFAVLFLHPKQTSLSIYDEHKHLVFTKSIEHGGLDIRKAVEAALPSDKKEFARKLCLQFGSLISSRSQTLRLGENFTINTLTLSQVMRQQMDAIMREFVPVFEDGTFHIGQFLIAGEGIGVDGMYDYGRNFVEDKLKLPIAVDFLLVPGACEVDLKKAARASGNKSCKPIPQKELLPLTGYIRGGCCPIGMKKPFPSYIDETCLLHEKIYVSAGQRGMQLRLTPQDLINYVPLEVSDLI